MKTVLSIRISYLLVNKNERTEFCMARLEILSEPRKDIVTVQCIDRVVGLGDQILTLNWP